MSRRGHGEGSIFQRKGGRWVGVVDLGWIGGKRQRRTYYATTQGEVQAKVGAATEAIRKGLTVQSRDTTTGAFLVGWLAKRQDGIRPSTLRQYNSILRTDLIPALGRIPLTKLSLQDVEAMMATAAAGTPGRAPLSPATIKQTRAVLRRALQDAMRLDLVYRNVAALAVGPKLAKREYVVMTVEQARAFLAAVAGDRLEGLYVLALATGLRQGEALGLLWSDIDFQTGKMSINKALQRVRGTLMLVPPKTDKSVRTLHMPKLAQEALLAHRSRQVEERLMAGQRWVETGHVFASPAGTPLDGTCVTRFFLLLLNRAGLPRMRFHDLRHCAASLMAVQGVPARTAMHTLGHSNIATTMDIYTHVLPSSLDDAADAMDVALGRLS